MLIPIKDDNPTVRRPYITVGLIILNALIFFYTQTLGYKGFQVFLFDYGYIPFYFTGNAAQMVVPSHVYLTPVFSMFLHGGWMHLIGNMLFLWIYGNNVEDYFGPIKFIIFYILSGFAAIALYTVIDPSSKVPLVGASGAIAGVMGAYLVLHPRARITCLLFFIFIQFLVLPAKVVLGIWFVYQVLMTMLGGSASGVAFWAHIGGFAFGWVIMKVLLKLKGQRPSSFDGQRVYRMHW